MLGADYYLAHAVHDNLWMGIQGAWLPSIGNTGGSVSNQVGNGAGSAVGVSGTANNHYWAKNSSQRLGLQVVAQGNGSNSYWLIPFRQSSVRQATISLWAGAQGVVSGSPIAATAGRYIFAWVDPNTWNTAWGLSQTNANGAMWLDAGWHGSQTTWAQGLRHYALTWGPGRVLTVYVNGAVIHSHTMAGAEPSVATEPTHVAIGIGFGGISGCAWDDLRTYSRALSPREILTLSERPGIAYKMTSRRMGYGSGGGGGGALSSVLAGRKTFSRVVA